MLFGGFFSWYCGCRTVRYRRASRTFPEHPPGGRGEAPPGARVQRPFPRLSCPQSAAQRRCSSGCWSSVLLHPPTPAHSNLIPETSGPDEPVNEAFPAAAITATDTHLPPPSRRWNDLRGPHTGEAPGRRRRLLKITPTSPPCLLHHPGIEDRETGRGGLTLVSSEARRRLAPPRANWRTVLF